MKKINKHKNYPDALEHRGNYDSIKKGQFLDNNDKITFDIISYSL